MSEKQEPKKKGMGEILLEEINSKPSGGSSWRKLGQTLAIPVLAIFSGLVLGAVIIAVTSESVYTTWAQSPLAAFGAAWEEVRIAYTALFTGSIGDPSRIIAALQSGDDLEIRRAFNPFLESLVASTCLLYTS
ncbi:MAG: hypothetical protein IMY80_01030, partial [Chloroflexi bacterium]|nr:hypothetical protein [Chloroflexota bacterium]